MNAVVAPSVSPSKEAAPKMLRLYKFPAGSGKYVFGSLLNADGKPKYPEMNGKVISFISGRYTTEDPKEIEELDDQIAKGYTGIIIDPREKEIDARAMDPMFRLKEKMRQELLAEMAAATNPNNDFGSYQQAALVASNTRTIASTAAGGTGEQSPAATNPKVAEMLAGLKKS
jgi:hypothetical protein